MEQRPDTDYVHVATLLNETAAAMATSVLTPSGIVFFIQGEGTHGFTGPLRLMVERGRSGEAQELLKDFGVV